ncbi:HEPN domain-containing protein [Patescibacteria group bacterium]|nr:HEPN domain-containing protein [Patescibacteria group bacterium]MBU4078491.1 HEPN domain-containing protein [Patescibacteria group bacterium]
MNLNFEKCLERGKIREFSRGRFLVGKEMEGAELDFKSAKESFQNKNYKWATIQTYYSMFHSARALLYNKNYREKSHYCLIEAIRTLYIDKGLIGHDFIEALQRAKTLREGADYYSEFNKESTESLVEIAEDFLKKVKDILI